MRINFLILWGFNNKLKVKIFDMNKIIGIRHEDKYVMERRVAITPLHVGKLIKEKGLEIIVQKSSKRAFNDEEYKNVNARLADNLDECPVIFGVKEIPISLFKKNKTYVFFSHIIKGQPYNMPMLKQMIKKQVNLIDYEKIVNDQGKRIIFFGKYAGLAGMINSLWTLGLRLKEFGYDTPFLDIKQSYTYHTLVEAKEAIAKVGKIIAEKGLPKELCPMVIGYTGYGNVSKGAQKIAELLPYKNISPEELLLLKNKKNIPNNLIYNVVFKESDLSETIDSNKDFELNDYYNNPQNYKSKFEQYIPHLSILMNCMYWDKRYPKLITRDYLKKAYTNNKPKLVVIGDVTCDPGGSIESTVKGTHIEDPIFVYNPFTDDIISGTKGEGIQVMAVDILPAELPRDSSAGFSDALIDYIEAIAVADYNSPFEEINLPDAIKNAMILHKGQFTPDYKYLEKYL